MALCHEMKPGETYVCENCGLELKVMRSCATHEEYDGGSGVCSCSEPVACCGRPLALKADG
jgi:hypothetical protein